MRWISMVVAAVGLACGGCGDDASGDSGGGSSGGGSGAADTTATTGLTTTSSGSSDSGSTGVAGFEVDIEIGFHGSQPMVIDVTASSAQNISEFELTHASDPGVLVDTPVFVPTNAVLSRVRGLTPDTDHTFDYRAVAETGEEVTGQVDVHTGPAQPGFVAAFALTTNTRPRPGYRMFDVFAFPDPLGNGVFMVDSAGITRWHLGAPTAASGPAAVWTAMHLRDDGTVSYLLDSVAYIKDELGASQMEVSATDLGVGPLHHELFELPNGNFLSMAYTFRDIDYPMMGTVHVAGDLLVEFTPAGQVVWSWDSFDHLDPQRTRAGFDLFIADPATGELGADWTHGNGLEWDPSDDSVLFSMRHQDWVIKIDRNTDAIEWRLGDEGDFTLGSGRWFFHQHSPQWQSDGTLVLYDNGVDNPMLPPDQVRSRAVRYAVDPMGMTADELWEDDEAPFVSQIAGDTNELADGRLLVTDSAIGTPRGLHARVRVVDPTASPTRVWAVETPVGRLIYRAVETSRLAGQSDLPPPE